MRTNSMQPPSARIEIKRDDLVYLLHDVEGYGLRRIATRFRDRRLLAAIANLRQAAGMRA